MSRGAPPRSRRGGVLGVVACALLTLGWYVPGELDDPRQMGRGEQLFEWDHDWPRLTAGDALGDTHGDIDFDSEGNVYVCTETERAVQVFTEGGRPLRSFGAEFAGGLHDILIRTEDEGEFCYLAHTAGHQVCKTTLEGEVLWRLGPPMESKVYESAEQFLPTSVAVAPNGHLFVADGYGLSVVHEFDAERNWVRTVGGMGDQIGQFRVPHGIAVIEWRGQEILFVADRENARVQGFNLQGRPLFVIEGMLRRPCGVERSGDFLIVPDLDGRVTILDSRFAPYTHMGEARIPSHRANHRVPAEEWRPGEFTAPHGAAVDAHGNLFVVDWNRTGRVTRLAKID